MMLPLGINNYKAPVKLRRRQERKLATPSQGEYNCDIQRRLFSSLSSESLARAVVTTIGNVLSSFFMQKLPQRVQRKRTKGFKLPPNTICIDRTTKWGNPFPIGKETSLGIMIDRELSLHLFRTHLTFEGRYLAELARKELKGKNLACFCPIDQPCHGDILLQIANS